LTPSCSSGNLKVKSQALESTYHSAGKSCELCDLDMTKRASDAGVDRRLRLVKSQNLGRRDTVQNLDRG